MFKFIHAADIHLDSPLGGLKRYEDAPADEIRQATRRALSGMVDLAIEEDVQFVLLAGDLYDGKWKDFKTGRFFLSEMFRLRDAGIRVFLILGNHDAANKMTKELDLRLAGVTLFDHRQAERVVLDELGVALHGQSYAKEAVDDDLSAGYPAGDSGLFNIGLLHTCGPGLHEGHERYAPCDLAVLRKKNYQYWALGHVHKRGVVSDDPLMVFSGNLQGRHIREEGAKGCMLVAVDARHRVTPEFREVDVFRWKCCTVDATDAGTADTLLDRVLQDFKNAAAEADGRPLAVRLEIVGRCGAHEKIAAEPVRWEEEFRSLARDAGDGRIWLEKVRLATSHPPDRLALHTEGPIAELLRTVNDMQHDSAQLADLVRELDPLIKQLPSPLTEGDDALGIADPASLGTILDQVREMLLRELTAAEGKR